MVYFYHHTVTKSHYNNTMGFQEYRDARTKYMAAGKTAGLLMQNRLIDGLNAVLGQLAGGLKLTWDFAKLKESAVRDQLEVHVRTSYDALVQERRGFNDETWADQDDFFRSADWELVIGADRDVVKNALREEGENFGEFSIANRTARAREGRVNNYLVNQRNTLLPEEELEAVATEAYAIDKAFWKRRYEFADDIGDPAAIEAMTNKGRDTLQADINALLGEEDEFVKISL